MADITPLSLESGRWVCIDFVWLLCIYGFKIWVYRKAQCRWFVMVFVVNMLTCEIHAKDCIDERERD